jgi:alpha-L-rhamnosidase
MPGLTVKYLRCEYKVNPAGIDVRTPRLSWLTEQLNPHQINQRQSACRIIVSSSYDNLVKDIADMWDSGKVFSDQSFHAEYKGKKLQSAKRYWWKVKVWSGNNEESGWSEPAEWVTGIFNKNERRAKWIGYDEYEREHKGKTKYKFVPGDKWIWLSSKRYSSLKEYPKVLFRYSFIIKSAADVKAAYLLVTADEGFKLYLNNTPAAGSDGRIFSWARPSFVSILQLLKNGLNDINVECINSYLEKPGFAAKIFITHRDGAEELIRTSGEWKASPADKTNLLQWEKSGIIAEMGDKPWRVPHHELFLPPPPYLRREFILKKKIKNAFLFISALGLVKAYLNGKSVSDDLFVPGWTDYNKRVCYKIYDVKELLAEKNCIGLLLAGGWYAGYIGWERRRGYYGDSPRCFMQLKLEYEDGSYEDIVTDETWKASYGPLREADILMGEKYDASLESAVAGWNLHGYDDSGWKNVTADKLNVELNSYPGEPVRRIQEIKPVKITSPGKGIYIFDLCQNIAGCARVKIDGRITRSVTLRFGEMLNSKGELYTDNIRMARAADTYITKGEAEEIWQPEFTYHGFRYIELTGYPVEPGENVITGIIMHSDLTVTGSFRCSNDKLNKLYQNIMWSQRANYFDIPTDCPQRDERLGWTADAVDFFRTAAYNMDISAFYTKWLRDLNDAQQPDGAYTAIAPQPDLGVGPLYAGAAGWADAGIITPYFLYQFYGDKNILEKYYTNMVRYMEYLEKNSKGYIRPDEGYGDWLSINADTPKDLIATAFYAYDAEFMSEISLLLNKPGQGQKFSRLSDNIKNAFNKAYILPDHTIKSGTQTAYALALAFGLLNEEDKKHAAANLVNDIVSRHYHVSTGFTGLHFILPLLSEYGFTDIAYKVLLNESFPSWMNMINNGATTLWERWDSYTPGKGIYDPLMNSFNHTSLGVVGEWLYSVIGGISPLEPAFKRIKIKPEPGDDLTCAETSYNSISGRIATSWRYENNIFNLNVSIPFNTTAEVYLLKKYGILTRIEPVCLYTENEDQYIIITGSGEHTFEMRTRVLDKSSTYNSVPL